MMNHDKLNYLIATKIMGWRRCVHSGRWLTGDDVNPVCGMFYPTVNERDALRVLIKLRENHTAKIWMSKDMWRVAIRHGGADVSEWAATLPLAICMAAAATVVVNAPAPSRPVAERQGGQR